MPDMTFRADRPAPGAVERFKQTLGRPLPPDYESFLAGFNGGRPACQFRFVPELDGLVEIDILFGIGLEAAFDIASWTARYAAELPADTLVIGGDPLGNLFSLDLAGGLVYYWDHVRLYERSDGGDSVYPVAADIDQFLEDEYETEEPLLSELMGPDGPKVPENIWFKEEDSSLREFERIFFVEHMHVEGYVLASLGD